jgi:hypothetical protein
MKNTQNWNTILTFVNHCDSVLHELFNTISFSDMLFDDTPDKNVSIFLPPKFVVNNGIILA